MQEYLIAFGREPELAVAEVAATARRFALPLQWRELDRTVGQASGEINDKFLDSLAGTVKVAEVLGETKTDKENICQFVAKQLEQAERCEFGLSWYGSKAPRWLMPAGLSIKNSLKNTNRHVRYVTSRTPVLSSVVVAKNKLLPPSGYEFFLLSAGDKVTIGRTLWVQDFEGWSKRDYGRPERDARVGMLPPKLARLMINLAEAHEGAGILDPFCGSGTVLQEASLMGYRHLVGVDADSSGINRTRNNFVWLKKTYQQIPEPALMVADISRLPTLLNNQYEAIVTEPYLGPPLRGREGLGRLEQIRQELTEFYKNTLKVLSLMIKPGGRIVMIWPVLRAGNQNLTLPIINDVKANGLELVDVLPKAAPASWRNNRGTLWYSRPDARVIREIAVLQKK